MGWIGYGIIVALVIITLVLASKVIQYKELAELYKNNYVHAYLNRNQGENLEGR